MNGRAQTTWYFPGGTEYLGIVPGGLPGQVTPPRVASGAAGLPWMPPAVITQGPAPTGMVPGAAPALPSAALLPGWVMTDLGPRPVPSRPGPAALPGIPTRPGGPMREYRGRRPGIAPPIRGPVLMPDDPSRTRVV